MNQIIPLALEAPAERHNRLISEYLPGFFHRGTELANPIETLMLLETLVLATLQTYYSGDIEAQTNALTVMCEAVIERMG